MKCLSTSSCIYCESNYVLLLKNLTCIINCPITFYAFAGYCKSCHISCLNCLNF